MPDKIITQERPALRVKATAAASTSTVCLVSIYIMRVDGAPGPHNAIVYLSDSAAGVGLNASDASGAVGVGASGVLLGTLTAKKALVMQTTAAGLVILSITDSAKQLFTVCVSIEGRSYPLVTLATASYG